MSLHFPGDCFLSILDLNSEDLESSSALIETIESNKNILFDGNE